MQKFSLSAFSLRLFCLLTLLTAVPPQSSAAPVTEVISYDSTITGSGSGPLVLKAELNYDSATADAPIAVVMHQFSAATGNFQAYRPNAQRLRDRGFFVLTVAMRGRDGSEGLRDSGALEIHDIYDAIQAVRAAYPALVSPDRVYITGYSGGGGNVMSALTKFPDTFTAASAFFGMSDYGYDSENGWYQNGASSSHRAILDTDIGNPLTGGALVLDRYRARASNLASGNNPYTDIHLFVNGDETISPPVNVTSYRDNALANGYAASYDNIHVYIGATDTWQDFNGNSVNDPGEEQDWPHQAPTAEQQAAAENWFLDSMLDGSLPVPTLAASGKLVVPGYVVTRPFRFWLGNGQEAAGELDYTLGTEEKTFTLSILTSNSSVQGRLIVDNSDYAGQRIEVYVNELRIDTVMADSANVVENVGHGDTVRLVPIGAPPEDDIVLLNETFADGNRTGQDLPTSAAWHTLGTLSTSISGTSLSIAPSNPTSEFTALAYFTDEGLHTLEIDQSIEVRFLVSATALSADPSPSTGLRLGLFDSGGQRLTQDIAAIESPILSGYRGFGTMLSLSTSAQANGVRLTRRTADDDNLLGRGAAYAVLNQFNSPASANNSPVEVVFRVNRVDADTVTTQVRFGTQIFGPSTVTGLTEPAFDTVGLWTTGRSGTITFSEISVTLSDILPPPGLTPIGKLRPRHAREIEDSPWSIGAETMDRSFTIYDNWREYLGPLGVKRARIQSGWAATESVEGVYDWTLLDNVIPDMPTQGVTPWVSLGYGNPIYPDGGTASVDSPLPTGDAALAGWDNFVAAIVTRYQAQVHEWEVWNEPDHGAFFKTPQAYGDFVIRTAETIRGIQPEAVIIFGAVTFGGMNSYLSDTVAHIAAQDKLHLIDVVSFHPYSSNPDAADGIIATMINKVTAIDPTLTFLQGENGAPSEQQTRFALRNEYWSETTQAKWALRRMLGDWGRGIPSSLFGIMEMDYDGEDNSKGLLALPGDRFLDRADEDKVVDHVKRGYFAVQHLTSLFDSALQPMGSISSATGSASTRVYGFQNAQGQSAVALWNGSAKPTDTELGGLTPRAAIHFPDLSFSDPLLVDLLTGRVFAIDDWQVVNGGSSFDSIPVYDSPVVIIERALVPLRSLTFLEWFDQHFVGLGPVEESALASLDAAPAGDGVANAIKYLLDLDPMEQADTLKGMLDGGTLTLTVRKRVDESTVRMIPEVSTDLITWNTNPDLLEILRMPDTPGFEQVEVRGNFSPESPPHLFMRLRFEWGPAGP